MFLDIDECFMGLDNCDSFTQECFNLPGSFTCRNSTKNTCPPGFKLNEVGLCIGMISAVKYYFWTSE